MSRISFFVCRGPECISQPCPTKPETRLQFVARGILAAMIGHMRQNRYKPYRGRATDEMNAVVKAIRVSNVKITSTFKGIGHQYCVVNIPFRHREERALGATNKIRHGRSISL